MKVHILIGLNGSIKIVQANNFYETVTLGRIIMTV